MDVFCGGGVLGQHYAAGKREGESNGAKMLGRFADWWMGSGSSQARTLSKPAVRSAGNAGFLTSAGRIRDDCGWRGMRWSGCDLGN